METFGSSAPGDVVLEKFGFNVDNIVAGIGATWLKVIVVYKLQKAARFGCLFTMMCKIRVIDIIFMSSII